MRPENEARLAKIKKLSWFLRAICILFMLESLISLFYFMTGPVLGHGRNWGIGILWQGYNGVEFKAYSLAFHERLLALACFTLTTAIAFFCAIQLFRLLGFYSHGEIFTRKAIRQIRLWSFACVAWGIVKLGWWSLVPLAITNSRHYGALDLSTLFNGLIIVAISWFMEMAAEIQEENELTV
jgi:hypothetical protein